MTMSTSRRSIIESLGVYLPPKEVSTAEVVKGCTHRLLLPLERLTGIKSRRMAGDSEFSYDLAAKAVDDCLAVSKYRVEDLDMIVCCNISRFDGPDEFSFEPSTAVKLRNAFGLRNVLAFDITNACVGMFTGIYLVDALIRTGAIRRGLVVSGEYITHLTKTAQKEIRGLADARIPCLTLGDAGAAVIIDATTDPERGFMGLELYTMGDHSSLCIAKVTDQPHGGAIMTTDMITLAQLSITAFMRHAANMAFQLGWSPGMVDHVVPHQTSKVSLGAGSREVKRLVADRLDFQDKVIDNVENRGNTATTSHFVALKDCFLNGRMKTGESAVFGILASGITVGTAMHRFDDLPDRVRKVAAEPIKPPASRSAPVPGSFMARDREPRVRIEAVGILDGKKITAKGTIPMLTEASENCLGHSAHKRGEIDVLLSTGVYRTDFLMEPAIAALLAGALKINGVPKSPVEKKTLAFDVVNGGLGLLNACHLASELVKNRNARTVMIATSEVENNAGVVPDCRRGIRETASALILDAAEDGRTGFGAFCFRSFPEYEKCLRVYGRSHSLHNDGRDVARLFVEQDADLAGKFVECIAVAVEELLAAEGLSGDAIKTVLPPQVSPEFIRRLSDRLGLAREKFVDVSEDGGDLFTSSLPYCIAYLRDNPRTRPGDLGLIINVAAGIQVGCAIYHF